MLKPADAIKPKAEPTHEKKVSEKLKMTETDGEGHNPRPNPIHEKVGFRNFKQLILAYNRIASSNPIFLLTQFFCGLSWPRVRLIYMTFVGFNTIVVMCFPTQANWVFPQTPLHAQDHFLRA